MSIAKIRKGIDLMRFGRLSIHRVRALGLICCLIAGLAAAGNRSAIAAEPDFVGVLAIAVEPDTARDLGLTGDKLSQLTQLIDKREAEVVNLALEVKDLPPAERAAKLGPF